MILTQAQKLEVLLPGTIWRRKSQGSWERVYLESLHSKLLRFGGGEVDIRTSFGLEHIPRAKFLSLYEFLGWARVKLPELTEDKNLIPLTIDVSVKGTRL